MLNFVDYLKVKNTEFNNYQLIYPLFNYTQIWIDFSSIKCKKRSFLLSNLILKEYDFKNIDESDFKRSLNMTTFSESEKFNDKDYDKYKYEMFLEHPDISKHISIDKTNMDKSIDIIYNFTMFKKDNEFNEMIGNLTNYNIDNIYFGHLFSKVECEFCFTDMNCRSSFSNIFYISTEFPKNNGNSTDSDKNNTDVKKPENNNSTDKKLENNNSTDITSFVEKIKNDLEIKLKINQPINNDIIKKFMDLFESNNSSINISSFKDFKNTSSYEEKNKILNNAIENLDKIMPENKEKKNEIIKASIIINSMISESCENNTKNDMCILNKQKIQNKILNSLNKTFDCQKLENKLLEKSSNSSFDIDEFFNLVLSIYFSSNNKDSFDKNNIESINFINDCIVKLSPFIIDKFENFTNKNFTKFFATELILLTTNMFSNMAKISSNYNDKESSNLTNNYNEKNNNSLIVKELNLEIKSLIEKNAISFMKLKTKLDENIYKELETENIYYHSMKCKKIYLKLKLFKIFLVNSIYKEKRIQKNARKIFDNKENNMFEKLKKIKRLRYINQIYETIEINEFDFKLKIILPMKYLIEEYNKEITSYGIIFYNKYPLMPSNPKNFTEKVISLKVFDSNFNEIKVKNLNKPIQIYFTKPLHLIDLKECIFFDNEYKTFRNNGCISKDYGNILQCDCNHLTDFSLAKFHPEIVFEDIINLITDTLIIKDFGLFKKLNSDNAYLFWILGVIIIIYFICMRITYVKDMKDGDKIYLYEIEEEYTLFSTKIVVDNMNKMKKISDENCQKRKVNAMKFVQFKIEAMIEENKISNGEIKENNNELKEEIENNNSNNKLNNSENPLEIINVKKNSRLCWLDKIKRKSDYKNFKSPKDNNDKEDINIDNKKLNKVKEIKRKTFIDSMIEMSFINQNQEEKNSTINSSSNDDNEIINQNIKVDENNIMILDQTLKHEEFLISVFQNNDHEINSEIKKYFQFKESRLPSKSDKSNKLNKLDKEKNSSFSFDGEKDLNNEFLKNVDDKNIIVTNNIYSDKSLDAGNEEVEEKTFEVSLKFYKFFKYFYTFWFIFKNQYRLICLFISHDSLFSKVNFLTICFSKMIATLGIGTMLSLSDVNNDNINSKVNIFFYNYFLFLK
jgi:hypothetical protein